MTVRFATPMAAPTATRTPSVPWPRRRQTVAGCDAKMARTGLAAIDAGGDL
jgi:hypothetical protein